MYLDLLLLNKIYNLSILWVVNNDVKVYKNIDFCAESPLNEKKIEYVYLN